MKTTDGSLAGTEGLDLRRGERRAFQGDSPFPQEAFSDGLI